MGEKTLLTHMMHGRDNVFVALVKGITANYQWPHLNPAFALTLGQLRNKEIASQLGAKQFNIKLTHQNMKNFVEQGLFDLSNTYKHQYKILEDIPKTLKEPDVFTIAKVGNVPTLFIGKGVYSKEYNEVWKAEWFRFEIKDNDVILNGIETTNGLDHKPPMWPKDNPMQRE
ncbi:hypothetical protein [Helicobacter sp. L8]|uniref:hypothetical protein n=1 Tax=Helicobacter sp. L8 TaxID=2316078 RepID=UPI000EB1C3E0|nr:hypothetical protein [Helicobacter sp. L8]